MAESQQERLREEVICPLCLDIFKDPKRLPCDHVYCSQCLHSLILRSVGGGAFTCPECRSNIPVPPNFDISTFSTPHQMNRLIEIHKANPKSTEALPSATPDPNNCTVHDSQPLALYCETCKSLVCRDCVILSCSKKNHKHGFIDDMAKKYHTILEEKLKPIRKHHQVMSSALDDIATAERESQGRKEEKLLKVNRTFDNIREILEQERNYFTKAIEDTFRKESDQNSAKREEISKVSSSLESLILSVETALNEPKPVFLADVAKKEESIENMHYKAMKISPHPVKLPEIEIRLWSATELKDLCQSKSFLYQKGDPLRGHFDRSYVSTIPRYNSTEVTFHIIPPQVKSIFNRKIKIDSQLHCCYDKHCETVNVKQITPDQYSLSFIPQKRGKHELRVICNGVHMSPIPVYVTIRPWEISTPTKAVTHLHNPAGVKCHNGKIYVCEVNRGLVVLSSTDHNILQTLKFSGICEVLITDNYFYITDIEKRRVVKMDIKTTTIVNSLGTKGNKPGQFDYPNGIRLSKDNEIYVCDGGGNNRIQVFDENLQLLRVLGGREDAKRYFGSPSDLYFDDGGDIYVVEQRKHLIQVLTPQGVHIRNIGRYGNRPGELNTPISAAIHRNMVYVTELNNRRISVFKKTGEFVTTFGEGTLSRPECIAIDDNSYIYVTNARSELIVF